MTSYRWSEPALRAEAAATHSPTLRSLIERDLSAVLSHNSTAGDTSA